MLEYYCICSMLKWKKYRYVVLIIVLIGLLGYFFYSYKDVIRIMVIRLLYVFQSMVRAMHWEKKQLE